MEKMNRYTVELGNNSYVLKSNRSREETDHIVRYVDKEIKKAEINISKRNPTMVATLAALNIADEYYNVLKDHEHLKEVASVPIEEYEPLKENYEKTLRFNKLLKEENDQLKKEIKDLKLQVELTSLDRDNFKLELDRKITSSDKMKFHLEDLMEKLKQQEKETLLAKKQLQENINRNRDMDEE